MIPLRDTIQSRNYPVVTISLISINVLVYFFHPAHGPDFQQFAYTYGLVPARYTTEEMARYFTTGQQVFAIFSFMFLHGGILHILGNMWILYIFGDNVEDFLGSFHYALFYLGGGLFSAMTHMALNLSSTTPVIGASGAVAAVMGAYFILYPTSRILTLIPIFFFPLFIEIPAFVFLAIWFMMQVFNAAGTAGMEGAGIAWWAHIGGFVFGVAAIKIVQNLYAASPGEDRKRWSGLQRRKSSHLQVVRPTSGGEGLDRKALLTVTPYEASVGTSKTINIPEGFQKRIYKVKIPAGIADGSVLRLRGLGRKNSQGERGDLYLEVRIDPSR
ncbi:MAG: rhomboid family intramembrane serine protease [Desulfosalsimonadaceae bacterium]